MTGDEFQFFENNEIIKAYEQDKNVQTTLCEPLEGEPGCLFHEFILLLGRIACNCIDTSPTLAGKLNDFFVEKLHFHRVQDSQKAHITYDDVTRRMYMSDDEGIFSDSDGEGSWETDSEEQMDEQQRRFYEFLQQKQDQQKDFILDYEQVLTELEPVLPPIPGKPEVT